MPDTAKDLAGYPFFPQQCLYFRPLPQGHESLRPTFGPVRIGLALATASPASLTTSLGRGPEGEAGLVEPKKALVDSCSVLCGTLRRNWAKAIRPEALRTTLWQTSSLM